jgi:iron complex transport system permease protein
LLALAGALMQVLLRNPLADPYILGISGGAGVGALLAIFFGLGVAGLNGFAFAGALLAILIVFGLAHGDGSWTQTRLLLTGVMVAAGCGAVITLLLSIAPEERLRGMLFWLMGDFSQGVNPTYALIGVAVIGLLTAPLARDLNVLIRGNDTAKALGVSVSMVRIAIYLLASMATAVSVTTAGSVGFVGLVIPHLTRMMVGNDQRVLLPTSMLAGGIFLVLADTLARVLIAPQQLPVGVVTALIGVPVFLYLLNRTRYQ